MHAARFILNYTFLTALLCLAAGQAQAAQGWVQSYKAGYTDASGTYCGGSEIMHIVPHKGKLYAFNGYWKDANFGKHSAQVLRLDSPNGQWQVDLETTKNALKYEQGNLMHMKGNILKSVTFKTDKNGKQIDVTLLVAGSWAFNNNEKGHQAVSFFQRDDASGRWTHTLLQDGPRDVPQEGQDKPVQIRRVPRDIEIYHDPATKVDRIFMLVGDPGILSGVYNSETGRIEWDTEPEHPKGGQAFPARPLGIAEANGTLYFSIGGQIFKRNNGPKPTWVEAYRIPGRVNTDVGGIRGLTAIPNPNGAGESLLFVWTPHGRALGDIKRLDGKELKDNTETTLRALWNNEKIPESGRPLYHLGGYNMLLPVKDPKSGKTVHLIGFQTKVADANEALVWNRYYKGAMYAIRTADRKYSVQEVNGRYAAPKPVLLAPRTFAHSPFPEEKGTIYFGGHDANGFMSTDMAWIFKADATTVLYGEK